MSVQDELKVMEEVKAKQEKEVDRDEKKVEESESACVSLKSPGKVRMLIHFSPRQRHFQCIRSPIPYTFPFNFLVRCFLSSVAACTAVFGSGWLICNNLQNGREPPYFFMCSISDLRYSNWYRFVTGL